jgi:2-(1,2-epoxy-1,2-dihydrophenyl)acetyl-CoA isomerase
MAEVETSRDGAVLTITLNRPDVLNAFNGAMHRALAGALKDARDGGVRAVVLTGAGRGFCAGQDLNDRAVSAGEHAVDLGLTVQTCWNPLIRTLTSLPQPVIARVNGVAAGAGANIALACDVVVAARSAKFIQAFAKIGLVPDSGGTWLLPRLIGRARARGLALLAEPLAAEEAEGWGLIWKVIDDESLIIEATKLAAHLATQPTFGLALTRRALDAAEMNSLDEQLDLERDLQNQAGRTPDYAEGVRAFFEKRPPSFTGRA